MLRQSTNWYLCNRSSHPYCVLTTRSRRGRLRNVALGLNITSNGPGTNRNIPNPSHAPVTSPSGRPPGCVLAVLTRDARTRGMRARSGPKTSRCSMLTWIEWKTIGAFPTRTATRTSFLPSARPMNIRVLQQENAPSRGRPGPACRPVRRVSGRRRQDDVVFLLRCPAVGARGAGRRG